MERRGEKSIKGSSHHAAPFQCGFSTFPPNLKENFLQALDFHSISSIQYLPTAISINGTQGHVYSIASSTNQEALMCTACDWHSPMHKGGETAHHYLSLALMYALFHQTLNEAFTLFFPPQNTSFETAAW